MEEKKRRGYKTQEQQTAANKRWEERNPEAKEKNKISRLKSTAKRFIKEFATLEELQELKNIITKRKEGINMGDKKEIVLYDLLGNKLKTLDASNVFQKDIYTIIIGDCSLKVEDHQDSGSANSRKTVTDDVFKKQYSTIKDRLTVYNKLDLYVEKKDSEFILVAISKEA